VGQERETTLRVGAETARGTALFETDEILFRPAKKGERRIAIKLAAITKVEVASGHLRVTTAAGVADFELGAHAEKWAEKIRSPKGRLDKLGAKAGAEVVLVGAFDDALRPELEARGCAVATRLRAGHALVLFAAEAKKELVKVPALRGALADDGALWIVYPKGKQEIREADVLAAGRAAKLTDHKVARFSETHTALKFVIPPALRKT
jgi:hypothetical protein